MGSNYKNDFLKIWKEWGFDDDEIKKLTHFFFYQYGRKDEIKNLGEANAESETGCRLLCDVKRLNKLLSYEYKFFESFMEGHISNSYSSSQAKKLKNILKNKEVAINLVVKILNNLVGKY